MDESTELRPTEVPATATQVGEIRGRWPWVEPSVWTDRMLTALEKGVKGGVWFSLIDKVWSLRNLEASFAKVKANRGAAGVDHVSAAEYALSLKANLERLSEQLRNSSYVPQEIRRTYIPKQGSKEMRPLGIPTVRDRVVQGALRHVLEPIFEKGFAEHSYGFRPGRGCKDALRRVDAQLKVGFRYVVDVDFKSYFDTIPHDRLLERIREKAADGRVLALVEAFLKAGVMEDAARWAPEAGAPQGAVLSPLLSNIYLDSLDRLAVDRGLEMTRYADDLVVLCRTPEEAERALTMVREWAEDNRLTIHPVKTRIVDFATESFDFLGYTFFQGKRKPRESSLRKLKDSVRTLTPRKTGQSLRDTIDALNLRLAGWFAYFKHSWKWTFPPLDSWIRMRLRSQLRKQLGLQGRGRGADHQRWTNAFFEEHGLYSLSTAHALARQSSSR
jgi:RNA-directed DNA polymerase